MSNVDVLLSHLEKVKQTGAGTYLARCPGHDDRTPSLAIRELDDGRILIHCFAGCSSHEVVSAVGMDLSDLFPPRSTGHKKSEKRRFPAADVLRAISLEALIVAAAGTALLAGEPFSGPDRNRLILAVSRIHSAVYACGVSHVS